MILDVVGRRLEAVVVPQSRDDVSHYQIGGVLGYKFEHEDAVLSQVALGETARHLAVTLRTSSAVGTQSSHDLEILTDVASTTALRQQHPGPADQTQRRQSTKQSQPEPQHQVDLLAEEVDG